MTACFLNDCMHPVLCKLITMAQIPSSVTSRRLVARPQLFQNDAPAVVKEKTKEVKEAVQSAAPSLPSVGLPSISLTPSLLALPGAHSSPS